MSTIQINVVPGRNPPQNHNFAKRRELTDEEKRILCEKWNSRQRMTHAEIGHVLGVSHTRVQQIEIKAMAKIRAALERELERRAEAEARRRTA